MNIPTNTNSNRDTFVTFIKRRWQLRAQAATPRRPAATCSAQIRGPSAVAGQRSSPHLTSLRLMPFLSATLPTPRVARRALAEGHAGTRPC
jgi:hypothetical protein